MLIPRTHLLKILTPFLDSINIVTLIFTLNIIISVKIELSLRLIIEQFRTDIISVLEILLHKLAKGWVRQREEIFGFGGTELAKSGLSKFDQEKLSSAPISNLVLDPSTMSLKLEVQRS